MGKKPLSEWEKNYRRSLNRCTLYLIIYMIILMGIGYEWLMWTTDNLTKY